MTEKKKNKRPAAGRKRHAKGRAAGCAAAFLAAFLIWTEPAQALAAGQGQDGETGTAAGSLESTETAGTDAENRAEHSLSGEELDELLDFIKEKWDAGELYGEDSIRKAIEEGEEKFGVVLEDSVKDQIADGMEKLDSLGLDHDTVIELAKKLYREHGDEIAENFQGLYEQYGSALTKSVEEAIAEQVVEPAKEAAKAAVEDTAKNFWKDLKNSVVSFLKNIFSGK